MSLLIQLGADVNAVAEHDVMPLNLAQSLPESTEKDEIVNKLLARYIIVLVLVLLSYYIEWSSSLTHRLYCVFVLIYSYSVVPRSRGGNRLQLRQLQ